ncbi:Hydroxymethylglutaryl-CoA synthase, cytoplasmic [Desmophyllum pertusum]|uniref:Hydroxymethylglutaryl-CoA synthase n=1 Tax=Desmophyllum pertusum TaxID=174260 RepID=A0A9X0D1F7_9CNID|nr:Hydroxymethylglutaryl-CoA synthase, cytoplasmic [Desmophyllum pertusum]
MPDKCCTARLGWPENVGIIAMEVYFPYNCVNQEKLEEFDGVSKGKYTIGLGQRNMGFCGDREDINSLSLTVVHKLMENNSINPDDIGRLEVGTETLIDKSKSVKSVLMQLFEESGNTNIEGVDTTNACYGGTQALFNAVSWIESSAWDGRLAIVVAADIAVYAAGSARSTGGAGAVAMLVGPGAPLVMERGMRSIHMQHAYDFYKPNMSSEYPVVDGKLSVRCYFHALDQCYSRYTEKGRQLDNKTLFTLEDIDYAMFHTPFCRIVQKSLARLMFHDFLCDPECDSSDGEKYADLAKFRNVKLEETFQDEAKGREIEKASMKCSQKVYDKKTEPSLCISRDVGNMYTPSLYGCLASLLFSESIEDLAGKRLMLFSYGSGLASAMFSFRISDDIGSSSPLHALVTSLKDIPARLESRRQVEPGEFLKTLTTREHTHNKNNYSPTCSEEELFPGTYYLTNVDEKFRRTYQRKTNQAVEESCMVV